LPEIQFDRVGLPDRAFSEWPVAVQETKMRPIVVIACLGPLLWVDSASAQTAPPVGYTFKISADPAMMSKSETD